MKAACAGKRRKIVHGVKEVADENEEENDHF